MHRSVTTSKRRGLQRAADAEYKGCCAVRPVGRRAVALLALVHGIHGGCGAILNTSEARVREITDRVERTNAAAFTRAFDARKAATGSHDAPALVDLFVGHAVRECARLNRVNAARFTNGETNTPPEQALDATELKSSSGASFVVRCSAFSVFGENARSLEAKDATGTDVLLISSSLALPSHGWMEVADTPGFSLMLGAHDEILRLYPQLNKVVKTSMSVPWTNRLCTPPFYQQQPVEQVYFWVLPGRHASEIKDALLNYDGEGYDLTCRGHYDGPQ